VFQTLFQSRSPAPVRPTIAVLHAYGPIASGESELDRWRIGDLVDHGAVELVQFDCTRSGGVTEFLRLANYAEMHGIEIVPHHDPQYHGHLVLAQRNGFGVETFPNAERDPLWDELYMSRPEFKDGWLI